MPRKRINKENYSPEQRAVKRGRPLYYDGPNSNCDPSLARDAITLYLTCGLGYSPIRHILNLPNDKKIEDVVRQHRFGRSKVNGEGGELECPIRKTIDDLAYSHIVSIAEKYGTLSDPYVIDMLDKRVWKDDPLHPIKTKCSICGKDIESTWICCPFCSTSIKKRRKGDNAA